MSIAEFVFWTIIAIGFVALVRLNRRANPPAKTMRPVMARADARRAFDINLRKGGAAYDSLHGSNINATGSIHALSDTEIKRLIDLCDSSPEEGLRQIDRLDVRARRNPFVMFARVVAFRRLLWGPIAEFDRRFGDDLYAFLRSLDGARIGYGIEGLKQVAEIEEVAPTFFIGERERVVDEIGMVIGKVRPGSVQQILGWTKVLFFHRDCYFFLDQGKGLDDVPQATWDKIHHIRFSAPLVARSIVAFEAILSDKDGWMITFGLFEAEAPPPEYEKRVVGVVTITESGRAWFRIGFFGASAAGDPVGRKTSGMNGGALAFVVLVVLSVAAYWYYSTKMAIRVSGPSEPSSFPSDTTATRQEVPAPFVPVPPTPQMDQPTLFTFEDWASPPFTAEYKQRYGVVPNSAIWADEDEAFAKMRAGYTPDVMGPCSYEFERWREAGLIQPIDVTKLRHWKDIPTSLKTIPGMMKSETEAWFVPQYWATTSVTYRMDLAPDYIGNESWRILFDPKYRGRVAGLDGVDDTVTLIARTWGVDPYNMSLRDWEVVKGKLREFVANARFISSDETSLTSGLKSGELVAAITWSQTPAALRREGVPVAYMNPPTGRFIYVCGLVMHAASTKLEQNYALIDSSISPTAMRYQLETLYNAPANTSILGAYSNEQLEHFGFDRDPESLLRSGTFQVRLKNKDEIMRFWLEIRGGG